MRTRRRLLGAAERLVAREGAHRLTLEAVAREADMSKGSLLYHFPTKDALVSGMIGDLIRAFEGSMDTRLRGEGDEPGRWSRAYARGTFEEEQGRRDLEVGAGLLAAVANDPTLLEPLREGYERWQSRAVRDGIDPALATVVRLASDGLWVADLLGLAPPTGDLRRKVMETLLSMTDVAEPSDGGEGT
ncbi:MAG: TetR/AcrR family transcriptional regulator [Rubrobacter sp.]